MHFCTCTNREMSILTYCKQSVLFVEFLMGNVNEYGMIKACNKESFQTRNPTQIWMKCMKSPEITVEIEKSPLI